MLALIISVALIGGLVVIDQVIKSIVSGNMLINQSITAIDGVLNWTYAENTGASFSMLKDHNWIVTALSSVLVVAIMSILVYSCIKGNFSHIVARASLILIAAGGIGNLIDRFFNNGRVVDYIDISPLFNFAIFNFADCCVCVGGFLLCIYVLFLHESKSEKDDVNAQEV